MPSSVMRWAARDIWLLCSLNHEDASVMSDAFKSRPVGQPPTRRLLMVLGLGTPV